MDMWTITGMSVIMINCWLRGAPKGAGP